MKPALFVFLLLVCNSAIAESYTPLTKSVDQFKGHYLYQSFSKAIKSQSISEAVDNWKKFIEEAQISGEPSELEDLTQYEMYRRGLSELARVYYISGNTTKGDKALEIQESITITEAPSKSLLGKICKKEFPNGF